MIFGLGKAKARIEGAYDAKGADFRYTAHVGYTLRGHENI